VGLAFVAGRFQVQRVNLETGQRTVIVDRFDGGNEAFPHESKGDVVFRDGQRLVMITSAGRRIDPLVSFPNLGWHGWARWTRTNDWIYFSGSLGLMRVRPDGTLPQEIASFGTYPDPSPNGTRLAWGDGNSLYVMDLTAPALTSPIATGAVPRWSPDGSLLAFVGQGQLRIARPDGTNLRVLTPNGADERSLDWTPDGEWILVSFVGVPTLVKADGTDRISLPLSNIFQLSVARP
jgi:dipeptidyl aminopeptidase/acylaminoacyl peptidase